MKKKIFADLHIHSTASDGMLSPTDVVKAAYSAGLSVIALTDHDTVKGIPEARLAAEIRGLRFISGIELSCGWPMDSDVSLHVVGLFIDHSSWELAHLLQEQQHARFRRALQMLDLLQELGINIEPLREEFMMNPNQTLGRPHIARFLVSSGVVSEFQDAFERYLKRGAPAYVPKPFLSPAKAVEVIKKAGGLAFIAHPGLLPEWETLWEAIKDIPWDGIEVFFSDHSEEHTKFFFDFAVSRNLLISGGSDFHGEYAEQAPKLGIFGLDENLFQKIWDRVNA